MSDPEDPGGTFSALHVENETNLPVDTERLRRLAARALGALGVPSEAELTVTLVDEERIAELKQDAFGVHAATDVLSFPMDDLDDPAPGPLVLGDVVICARVAIRQARALGRAPDDEFADLCIHGILHVCGRDHATPEAELAMAREQRALLVGMA